MIQSATFFTKQGERKMATPIRNLMKTCAAMALAFAATTATAAARGMIA